VKLQGEGKLLRIFIGESDQWNHKPLYEELVHKARDMGLAGATVVRGIEGFGAKSRLHTTRILRLSEDLPLVIELVDTAEKIDGFLAEVDDMVEEGMVTVETVEVRKYQARNQDKDA
jgi:PII-like signaling protein